MKRWAWLPVVFAALLAVLLLTGCGATSPSYSVDVADHSATFTVGRDGEPGVFAVLLSYLDGSWVSVGQDDDVADFGASVSSAGLKAGPWHYVIFWLPKSDYDPETMGAATLADKGREISGQFVI